MTHDAKLAAATRLARARELAAQAREAIAGGAYGIAAELLQVIFEEIPAKLIRRVSAQRMLAAPRTAQ